MKVIFVGVHNKKGMTPLDSKSKSGKLIDRIIDELPFECVKTNLYDTTEIPKKKDKLHLSVGWHRRVDYNSGVDIIILLGKEVQSNFRPFDIENIIKTIKVAHPSSIWSNKNKDKYVETTVNSVINPNR